MKIGVLALQGAFLEHQVILEGLGAEVIQAQSTDQKDISKPVLGFLPAKILRMDKADIGAAILQVVKDKRITTVCIGKPHLKLFHVILKTSVFNQLLTALSENDVDLVILS